MDIIKPSDIIFKKEFTSLKKISNGEALSSPYYTIIEPQSFDASGISENLIEIGSEEFVFNLGESILIKDSNNILRKNMITAVSIQGDGFTCYELLNNISDSLINKDSTLVKIQQINKKIVFTNLPEDEYYIIPTNEKLVCRATFANINIDFSDFVVFYPDSKNYNEFEHDKLNKVALNDVYADLSGYDDFYNTIHFASLEQLVRLKMMCLITNRFASQNTQLQDETPCKKYKDALMNFTVKLKLVNNIDNKPSGQAPQQNVSTKWGW